MGWTEKKNVLHKTEWAKKNLTRTALYACIHNEAQFEREHELSK